MRKWFAHRAERWPEFRRRYIEELDAKPDTWKPILDAARRGAVTLLYSAHDTEHNSAVILRDYLHGARCVVTAKRSGAPAKRR